MMRVRWVSGAATLAIAIPVLGQADGDRGRFPSELSGPERAALYGETRRLPLVAQNGFTLDLRYLSAHVQLSEKMTDTGSRTLGLSGELRWTKQAGDFLVSAVAIPREARDGDGRSFLGRWEQSPSWSGYKEHWRVDAYRSNAKPEENCPVTLEFDNLRELPEAIGVLAAEIPVWRVVGAETIAIPLELTPTPLHLKPDWTAEVFAEKDFSGMPFLVVRLAYWGEQVEIIPDRVSLPHLLGPEACDWLGPDGSRDPQLTWHPTRVSPAEAKDFAERGARVWRWGFRAITDEFLAGRSIRIRIVDRLEYDPIPFEIRDVPLLAERPLAPEQQAPKRVSERGPLRVEFAESLQAIQLFQHEPGEPSASVFLRGTLFKQPSPEPLGMLLVPIVELAEDQDGGTILAGYSPPNDPLRNSIYNDWLDLERDYTGQRQVQVALRFRVDPGTTVLRHLKATVPVWRATSVREYCVPVRATERPFVDEDGLQIHVLSVQERDEADVVVTVRVDVENAPELGGLPMPWVITPAIVHALKRYDDGSQILRARRSGQEGGRRWVEFTCSTTPLTIEADGAVIRVRVVSEADYEPLEFELTDFPLRR